jgi:ABC-type polar amino acid transport system ATPase subunit
MVFQHFNPFDHLTALENIIKAPVPQHARPAAASIWPNPLRRV